MKPFLLLFGLLFVVPATGQKHAHAPILEQCKADVAVWGDSGAQLEYSKAQLAFIEDGTPNKTEINKLSMQELTERMSEMVDCMKEVDPVVEAKDYQSVMSFYQNIEGDRAYDFIVRHGLHDRFRVEKKQGKG